MSNIKMLIFIVNEGYYQRTNLLFSQLGIKFKAVTSANGTATPSILDYFGLVQTKKSVFFAIIPDYQTSNIFKKIKSFVKLYKKSFGIAIAVPISSSNKFLNSSKKTTLNKGVEIMKKKNEQKFELIITLVNSGYVEDVTKCVRDIAGAGGTLIKGHDLSNIISKNVLGFNLESEREIILNVVYEKDKKQVMKAITKEFGIKTEARGVCFSVPVSDTMGLEMYK